MAIATTYHYTIDLDKGGLREVLRDPLYTLNSKAHTFALEIKQGSAAANLSGANCKAYFIRADGVTVPIDGTVSSNVASVTLLPNCYAVQGRFELSVDLILGDVIHTVLHADGSLYRTRTDALTTGGGPVQSFDELVSAVQGVDAELKRRDRVWNALDNSDFRNTVNQRGKTTYTGEEYAIDRWILSGNAEYENTMWIADGYVGLSGGNTTENVWLVQRVPSDAIPTGKSATFAVEQNGVGVFILNINSWGTDASVSFDSGISLLYQNGEVIIFNGTKQPAGFVWAALYEGTYTADTLPEYQPKGYGAELAECQRYYHLYATMDARPAHGMDCSPPMRINAPTQGTITIDGTIYYYNDADL